MKGAFSWNDRYAGDEAWREWFEVCSVALCGDGHAAALRAQIEAAMYARLAKCGVPKDDMGGEDPVAFFDSFFKLKGSRESPKPLKSYFAYRIAAEEGFRLRHSFRRGLRPGERHRNRLDIGRERVEAPQRVRRRRPPSPRMGDVGHGAGRLDRAGRHVRPGRSSGRRADAPRSGGRARGRLDENKNGKTGCRVPFVFDGA